MDRGNELLRDARSKLKSHRAGSVPWRIALVTLPLLLGVRLLSLTVAGEDLMPRVVSGNLLVTAPKLHFISGKSLENLHNGAAVPFDFQLSLAGEPKGNPLARSFERFVVSYDVWEEKFSVVRLRDLRKSSLRLTATAAESWCLENLSVPAAGIAVDRNVWVRLEIRTGESRDPRQASGADGISLATLVELFSRPARPQDHWSIENGPFRLAGLKR